MAVYTVVAPAVQVRVGARDYFLEAGAVLPEGADPDAVAHLLEVGMIAENPPVKAPKAPSKVGK